MYDSIYDFIVASITSYKHSEASKTSRGKQKIGCAGNSDRTKGKTAPIYNEGASSNIKTS